MKVFNFVSKTQKWAIGLVALTTLTCTEALLVSTFAHALEIASGNILTNSSQQLQALGSYRCANSDGKNVIRVKLTKKDGENYNLNVKGAGETWNYNTLETSKDGNGNAYTFYDSKSNFTYKFTEYPNGSYNLAARLVMSAETASGEQKLLDTKTCTKIGGSPVLLVISFINLKSKLASVTESFQSL